jgi:XapX domain-containing protein
MKQALALLLALGIGALCGRFQIPLPAPPHWFGVALIACIWLGYVLAKPS